MSIKDLMPQVLLGILVLGVLSWGAMQMGYDPLAGVGIGGIVAAVTQLTKS